MEIIEETQVAQFTSVFSKSYHYSTWVSSIFFHIFSPFNLPFFHIFPIFSFGGGGGGGYKLTIYILFDRYPYLVVLHL
jgi:hypothetical protein